MQLSAEKKTRDKQKVNKRQRQDTERKVYKGSRQSKRKSPEWKKTKGTEGKKNQEHLKLGESASCDRAVETQMPVR